MSEQNRSRPELARAEAEADAALGIWEKAFPMRRASDVPPADRGPNRIDRGPDTWLGARGLEELH